MLKPKHDHRQSLWIVAMSGGGAVYWCYRCGAMRHTKYYQGEVSKWYKPVGLDGENPAMKEYDKQNTGN